MMKKEMKEKAILLRADGLSIGDISKELKVSKSSVSLWVRCVELSVEQKESLKNKNPIFNRYYHSSKSIINNARKKRHIYQNEGKNLVRNTNGVKRDLLISGCMLYWGEGSKKRNSVILCNSDVNLLKYFISFLTTFFNIDKNKIGLYINCHTDIHSIEEIETYWLNQLDLTKKNCRKHSINYFPESKKRNKLPYGICTICIYNTKIAQQIYGAIQEIANFSNLKWIE